ncbi:unnamed protein product [Mesocestoides corti]|uniref:Multidrug and toxin extrusion protein n=1 Tax=Mesocestoides corti TaxID=53468 RepID=A0A3P6H3J3_MESCO|nr:unnamed protein product [Mesocestoides corti]
MINYLIAPVSLFFLGQLGKTELAAGGLAIAIFHVAGVSIVVGLLSASETFFSQTFGGSNKFRLGIQVQRAAVILLICCFPCWAIYIIIEPILLASKQPPLVAKGSALSQSLGYVMQAATVIAYIFISRLYRKTWDSVHVELWHDWGLWFRLAIPGMLMSGLEWWVCESGSLVSGLRGEQALAAQTIINNIESVIYCTFPLGFGIASTIRIGQFLGANKAVGPRSTALVALAMIAFTTVINAFILTFARYQIPRIFTNDRGVIEMVGQSLFSIVAFQFVDSIVGVASGIIRGVGMQQVGAIVCGVCMYLVGGPIGLCLLLLTDLSVAGFWWGLTAGMGLESIIYVILILKIDWNDMCTKAAKRTEIKFVHAVPGQREIEIKGLFPIFQFIKQKTSIVAKKAIDHFTVVTLIHCDPFCSHPFALKLIQVFSKTKVENVVVHA